MNILIHFDEIALKGKNRKWFEDILIKNIEFALKKVKNFKIIKLSARFLLEINDNNINFEDIKLILKNIFGICNFSLTKIAKPNLEDVKSSIKELYTPQNNNKYSTFAIKVKRAYKKYNLNSQEIAKEIGAFFKEYSKLNVNLNNPDLTIFIEWLKDKVFIYTEKIEAEEGLPLGVSGRVLSLISGGIDSPVSSYLIMKRGAFPYFIHFHSFPFTNEASQNKVKEIVKILCKNRCNTLLKLVPFGELQQEIVTNTPSPYRVILYRRFMIRISQKIAQDLGAQALVTGESLGQVASQTLSNLYTIQSVANIPILRPLIGMSKKEIVEIAKKINTYNLSIEPAPDCCSFLMPKFPKTKSKIEEIEKIEQSLNIEKLVQDTIQNIENIEING